LNPSGILITSSSSTISDLSRRVRRCDWTQLQLWQ